MKISGATSSTAMAVCRPSSPHRRRRPEHHRHEPDPEAGDHVHGERGEEGDPQRAHGGAAHPFGGRRHLAAPLLLAPEGPQGRQTLHQLEEAARQGAEPRHWRSERFVASRPK